MKPLPVPTSCMELVITENSECPLLGFLIALMKELKNQCKWKLKDKFIRILKENL